MTTMSQAVPAPRFVLADLVPSSRVRDVGLIFAGAMLTVIGAQIAIQVPPSPVPITGQTLAVVLAGGALGARRGAASQTLYVLLGLLLPVYADGGQGLGVLWGPTGGYLVGFVIAAAIVGKLAEMGADRRVLAATAAFAGGQLAIFGIGVPWLKFATDMAWADAIHNGFTLFIVGGIIKAVLAGALIPGVWRLVRGIERVTPDRRDA